MSLFNVKCISSKLNFFNKFKMLKYSTLPSDFNPEIYLMLNPDVHAAGVDPIKHYLEFGVNENRVYKLEVKDFEATLSEFLAEEPDEQNAFNLFSKSWSTRFDSVVTNGAASLADDERIKWLLDRVKVNNKNILELGPLEAGHTYMLEKAGAKVLAIEANKGAFLRCLIVKNYLNLSSKFMLGNFEKLNLNGMQFEMIIASGVLYHMRDPIALLRHLSSASDKIFIWTHYFEPNLSLWSNKLQGHLKSGKWEIGNIIRRKLGTLEIRMIRQNYRESLGWSGFCGGTETYSNWLYKDDLIALLKFLGYKNIEISFDQVEHQNGPALCILAQK